MAFEMLKHTKNFLRMCVTMVNMLIYY